MIDRKKKVYRMLILDDQYGKINSHWAYSTSDLEIVERIYYDEPSFLECIIKTLEMENLDAIGFSGRGAPNAAKGIELYIKQNKKYLSEWYKNLPKIFKLHNTNLSDKYGDCYLSKTKLCSIGNDWVKAAFQYPFDTLLVQTYGDAEIFNKLFETQKAFWFPYFYNDHLFYQRDSIKDLDIGAFFKLERHPHRIDFIKRIKTYIDNRGYTFEFSDQYWGEEYARNICRPKVLVHLSYCGDVPWRLYESAASGTCFISDKLSFHIERLFEDKCLVEYKRDFSNLEDKLDQILQNDKYRLGIIKNACQRVQSHTWEQGVKRYLVPILDSIV